MESYTSFAEVYDTFMDNVPYREWAAYVNNILKKHGIGEGTVLDLGCGTGSMTEELDDLGYDMIGVDISDEMLEIAVRKMEEKEREILYLSQDMRELELYSTVDAVVSACDSVNYILDMEELTDVFRLVNEYLEPGGGIFFFDFNTRHKYRDIIGDQTIAEDREECSFIWDNYYYEEECVNEYELTLFIQESEDETLYRKYQETHLQRGYTLEEMKTMIEDAGLIFETAYDDYTGKPADENSERICVVARECGK